MLRPYHTESYPSKSIISKVMGNTIMRSRASVDEKYTRPQGEYDPKDGDYRKLRRLILNGQLAPCFPGTEECSSELDECPICFLFYPSLNRSRCCSKAICTECYLQITSARFARSTQCPFCKALSYMVDYRGAKTMEEKGVEQAEEQKMIEAKIRIRQKELHDEEERARRLGEDTQAEPFEDETNHTLMEPGMSTQAAHVQGSLHQLERNDGFDVDTEDMMLMEAIWLSIQEQGQMRQDFALAQQIPSSSASSEKGIFDSNTEIAGRRFSVTGGLTKAVAALAQRQAITAEIRGGDQVVNSRNLNKDMPSCKFRDLATGSCTIDPSQWDFGAHRASQKEKQDVPWEKWRDGEQNWHTSSSGSDEEPNGWLNISKESGRTFCSSVDRELTFDWGLDERSEAMEAGTSFSSNIPSASDLPWEDPDFLPCRSSDNVGETSLSIASEARVLPVSFEEQVMLAMALSLADAQPQARRQ